MEIKSNQHLTLLCIVSLSVEDSIVQLKNKTKKKRCIST